MHARVDAGGHIGSEEEVRNECGIRHMPARHEASGSFFDFASTFDTGWFRGVMASALKNPVFLFFALLAALPSLSRADADAKITVHLVELIQKVPFRRGE